MGRKGHVADRNEQTFKAIKKLWKEKNGSPTLREIGIEIGIASTFLIQGYVKNLIKQGKIKRDESKGSRNLIIVELLSPKSTATLKQNSRVVLLGSRKDILEIPNFGAIAAGSPLHLPNASFSNADKDQSDHAVVQIPESYLPEGVKAGDVFALHVEGNSMRDAMLTDGDIVILQRTSIAQVKDGEIVAAWIINTQETTLKRFERTKRGIVLRPENPTYKPLHLQPDEVDIQGKLLAVLRFRYQASKLSR